MSESLVLELRLTSDARVLQAVRAAVERMAITAGFDDLTAGQYTLAVHEALANVIEHAYEGRPGRPIRLELREQVDAAGRRGLETVIEHEGCQVDASCIQGRPLDEIRPGGLGVHIIRAVMDVCEYSCRAQGGMMVRLVKHVAGPRKKAGSGGKARTKAKVNRT